MISYFFWRIFGTCTISWHMFGKNSYWQYFPPSCHKYILFDKFQTRIQCNRGKLNSSSILKYWIDAIILNRYNNFRLKIIDKKKQKDPDCFENLFFRFYCIFDHRREWKMLIVNKIFSILINKVSKRLTYYHLDK